MSAKYSRTILSVSVIGEVRAIDASSTSPVDTICPYAVSAGTVVPIDVTARTARMTVDKISLLS